MVKKSFTDLGSFVTGWMAGECLTSGTQISTQMNLPCLMSEAGRASRGVSNMRQGQCSEGHVKK